MRRWIATVTFVLALAVAFAPRAAAEYRTVDAHGLRITLDSEWPTVSAETGYLPFRFDITNLADDRVIEIVGNGQQSSATSGGYSFSELTVTRRVRLARAARVRFTIDVPLSGDTHIQFRIVEDGRPIETFGFTSANRYLGSGALVVVASGSTYASSAPAWMRPRGNPSFGMPMAVTAVVPTAPTGAAPSPGTTAPAPPAAPSGPPADLVLEPQRLPASWLGYSSLQGVAIGPREWEALEPGQRGALLTWTAAGGQLLLMDAGLDLMFPDPQDRPALEAGGARAPYFFGNIHLHGSEAIADAAGFDTLLQNAAAAGSPWALPSKSATPAAGGGLRMPIPGVDAIPTRAYLFILVLFAVLIGPVNYVFLRRWRQQSLIVLTTPAIAAAFIVLLGGYVTVVEGFAVRGRTLTFTKLDQGRNLAATRSLVSLYAAGRAPSGGAQFGRDVAVFWVGRDAANSVRRHLDLTETQRFASGMIEARTPASFDTISVRTARERLAFRRQDDRLTVVNGLGATVVRLVYRSGGSSYVLQEALPQGATGVLQPGTLAASLLWPSFAAAGRPPDEIVNPPDGSYLAVLEHSPFLEAGVPNLQERESFHLVWGTTDGQP